MADAVVSLAIQTISELVIDELKFRAGIRDEAEHLQEMLLQLSWFLKDADAIQSEVDGLQDWASKVKGIADEAKLVLDRYIAKVESQRKGGYKNVLKRISSNFIMHSKMGMKIQDFINRIFDLTEEMEKSGIIDKMQPAVSSRSIIKEERRTHSHDDDPKDFVGLEKDVETLANHLIKKDGQGGSYRVVSIYGIGGSGKTTLARKVCKRVKRYFYRVAWVYASQQGEPKEVLQKILHQLLPEETEEFKEWETVDEPCTKLSQFLISRRCLVVLDGIGSTDTWENIKDAFPSGEMWSRIMLTRRNKKVALHIDPNGFHHQPRLLDENESWELLKRKAFRAGHYEDFKETGKIEELGRKMAEHCRGLPLAVVVLGRILAEKDPLTGWESVYEDIVGDLQGELLNTFASSCYIDMPYQMKPCFLYLAQYPKDTYIYVLTLYQLWIAEGMIITRDRPEDKTVMEMAERYLCTLADLSRVQIQGDDFSVSRKFDSCRLHEMIRDFYLEEGRKETPVRVMDFRDSSNDKLLTESAASRLVIYTNTGLDDVGSDKVARVAHETLRSLEFHNTCEAKQLPPRIALSPNLLKKLKYLKSLVFESYKFVDHDNLEEVFKTLVHLRFLSFKDCDLDMLPSSVCSLPYLQTLDLRVQWGYPFQLPKNQWKTERLQCLFFSDSSVQVVKGKLRLRGLSQLERIVNFQTDKMEVGDLLQLRPLRMFTAIGRDNNSLSLIVDNLKAAKMELRVRYCYFKNGSDLLRKVLECPQLFSLEILGPLGVELPKVKDVACLAELVLVHTEINEDPMETLEMIPNLQRLVLCNNAYLGEQMRCSNNGFPNLKSLCLTELPSLENWKIENGAMPDLSRLVIKRCTKLKVLDGLNFLTTLKQLNTWSLSAELNDRVQELKNKWEGKECTFNLN